MDELYEEWLLGTCGLDPEKARRIREKFPNMEELANSNPERIAKLCELTIEEATAVHAKATESLSVGDKWYSRRSELFLCPECGSFAGADAKRCPQCGADFAGDEEEAGPPAEASPANEAVGSPELYICSNCGAFLSKEAKSCPTCGQIAEEAEAVEEELPRELVAQVEREEVSVCSRCGAFLAPQAEKCGICGHTLGEEKPHKEARPEELAPREVKEPSGVSKDFLARWQRIAERTPTRVEQLEEELRHYDELLEVDPKLERAWVLKSHVLRELGRSKDAALCLERAASINPQREEEYRLQVLNLAETLADSSIIPPRWSAIPPPEKPVSEISAIQKALGFYERLLRADPRQDVAWETRAELLQRLGRTDEADASRARARDVRRIKIEGERRALDGLRTPGVPRVKGVAREGRVNGLVNGVGRTNGLVNGTGRTNGLVNGIGRTNGLVNGLGRTNGLVNGIGRTNGLVNGIGRTNGLVNGLGRVNGLVNGIGHVNGLVNGNGFTNGRRGRYRKSFQPERSWLGSAGVVAAVVAVLLAAPMIATFLSQGPHVTIFKVDGEFSEWSGIAAHPDSLWDTRGANSTYRPEMDIVSTKVSVQNSQLAIFIQVNGAFFDTPAGTVAPEYVEYVIAMVDSDDRQSTGYTINGIGADAQIILSGYDGKLASSRLLDWKPELGGGHNNISAFRQRTEISAASSGGGLEFMFPLLNADEARILILTANTTGAIDTAGDIMCPFETTLKVSQRTIANDVVTQSQVAILGVRMESVAGSSDIHAVNLTKQGTIPDQSVSLSLYQDDNDGLFEPADTLIGTATPSAGSASFDVELKVNEGDALSFFVVADLMSANDADSILLRISGVFTDSLPDLSDALVTGVYYRQAPGVTIDGAFGDWDQSKIQRDALWDVRSVGGTQTMNTNVDITAVGLNVTSDFSVYMEVQGRILGGESLPNLAQRPMENPYPDSDLDTVPDAVDTMPNDFNNDGVSDSQTNHDVDGDGVPDYPEGPDFWLNTTIPAYFPAQYAGRIISRFIGPLSYNVPTGVDTAFAYVDADNSTATGLYAEVDGSVYGVDYALVVSGRGGEIDNASLYRYRRGTNIPFEWMRGIAAAIDPTRIEVAVNATVLGLVSGFRVVAYTTDWMRDMDSLSPVFTRGGKYGVRSVAGDNVVLNEISPRKSGAWIELANPTASPLALNGWRLQVFKGNKYITLYTFTSEIIGAWLSGTEYLAVNVPSGDLPTANGDIVLRNAANVIVDATTYPNIATGMTWSRFKAPIDGKPVDTDASTDWYASSLPSRGGANDRTRPMIAVVKTVNTMTAGPGDFVQYSIYYNNTGDGQSNRVWINDTLPSDVVFYSSSVPPSSFSGNTYRWVFTNVPQGAQRSFTVIVQVSGTALDSSVQVNTATLQYADQLGRGMGTSTSWANFTCIRPMIKVEKTASPSVALPGVIVTYTIYFNNTGSANALRVWINDTLPNEVTYIGASTPPSSWSGQTYRWIFANVAPGAHSFTITVQINNPCTSSVLINWVFLNYSSQGGFKLEESRASATVLIPEFQEVVVPIAIPILMFIASRVKRKKSEAVADSVPPTNGR